MQLIMKRMENIDMYFGYRRKEGISDLEKPRRNN